MGGARFAATLSPGDYPTDLVPLEPGHEINRGEQRLTGQESDMRLHTQKPFDAPIGPALILGGGPQPYILAWAYCPWIDMLDMSGPFRQQEPVKMRSIFDERPESFAPRIKIGARLENIRHGGAENSRSNT
jgi:hypothetical protein